MTEQLGTALGRDTTEAERVWGVVKGRGARVIELEGVGGAVGSLV